MRFEVSRLQLFSCTCLHCCVHQRSMMSLAVALLVLCRAPLHTDWQKLGVEFAKLLPEFFAGK